MITEQPEEWGNPFSKWFENNIGTMEEDDLVRARTPSGTVIEMSRVQFNNKVAVGLSLTEVEDD